MFMYRVGFGAVVAMMLVAIAATGCSSEVMGVNNTGTPTVKFEFDEEFLNGLSASVEERLMAEGVSLTPGSTSCAPSDVPGQYGTQFTCVVNGERVEVQTNDSHTRFSVIIPGEVPQWYPIKLSN